MQAMSKAHDKLLSIFTEQREALTRFLTRRLGSATLAEDLTQETWVRAASGGVATLTNPAGYLFRIASNLALDHLRHVGQGIEVQVDEKAAASVPDPAPWPEAVALHRGELNRLLRAVEGLSPRCREVFVLVKLDGLSYGEVAHRLGISKNTVMVHMVKALSTLEREMGASTEGKGDGS
jgi:RNA polymerase sigma-70 factor (ECF subfamily)